MIFTTIHRSKNKLDGFLEQSKLVVFCSYFSTPTITYHEHAHKKNQIELIKIYKLKLLLNFTTSTLFTICDMKTLESIIT